MAISQKLLSDGETVVVSTRTHVKALLAPLLVLVVVLAAAVFVQVVADNRFVTMFVWAVAAVVLLRYVVWPFLGWVTASYAFTDRRLVTRTGVLTRRGHDIPLSRISDVAIELHLTDRMLGCGTLVISDASTHGQVRLPDIPQVEDVQRRLNDLLHAIHDPRPDRRDEGA
ncbi:PH domain-containing protein [Nocardioides marmotae]|uniref:PH domain-containing protein n=1 Tax=Nocardioides marmotae TaxID=2663857 RepID=A0A6I3J357_9ACTN|nr:PH domain-containing protein [Nocardioides marmotae]MCR6031387.1 PH domain-containing protein [Gordonia jinghuaiqii]MBC9735484.1 PH domain-containing protein [Nocardioides marmotae]MTB86581.1 PH domain-containing protein [Nocardioides marmotae]MTB95026.1 PH domain-containing protein [Nocardioides marmotae]QKE02475.1 PH domain-containing protein [Nocardioides marmotae]